MSANIRLTASLRNAIAQLYQSYIDGGTGAGTIEIRSGTQPASADDAAVGTLLATLTFTDPSAPAAATGVLTMSAITEDVAADNTGTASWARVKNSTGTTIFDCNVGVSDAFIILNSVSITAGEFVTITAMTITVPAEQTWTP